MTSTKRLYLAPDAPAVYASDHYLIMDKVGSESAVKILASDLFSGAIGNYVGGNIAHLTNGTSAAIATATGRLPRRRAGKQENNDNWKWNRNTNSSIIRRVYIQ